MVVISTLAMVLGIVGVLFHRLFQAELISAKSTMVEVATMRLADQFRHDVHESATVIPLGESGDPRVMLGVMLELNGRQDGATVSYTADKNQVRREVKQQQTVLARETYRLPGCRVTFSAPELAGGMDDKLPASPVAFVALHLERPHATVSVPNPRHVLLREIVIDAELGRDRRLAASAAAVSRVEEGQP